MSPHILDGKSGDGCYQWVRQSPSGKDTSGNSLYLYLGAYSRLTTSETLSGCTFEVRVTGHSLLSFLITPSNRINRPEAGAQHFVQHLLHQIQQFYIEFSTLSKAAMSLFDRKKGKVIYLKVTEKSE